MSFFKTPAWAQPQPAKVEEDDEKEDLFSHKSSFLSNVKAQSERQKKEKEREERKKARKEEKRRSSEKRKSEEGAENGDIKKRRITAEESSKLLAKAGLGSNIIDLSDGEDEPVEQQLPVRRSPRHTRVKDVFSPARLKSKLPAPIDFGNESEEEIQITASSSRPPPPPPEPEEDLDSDPEIAELQRKAREKARAKQQPAPKSASPDAAGSSDLTPSTPSAPDPPVKILITSRIPNTNALIVCRKLSQRLKEAQQAWCQKQGFSKEFASKVFFVHRGRKYWNSSTVRRFGLDVDAEGTIFRVDDPTQEKVDQVHVEAVTQELFDEMQAEKAREAKAVSGMQEEEEEEQAEEGAAEEAPEPQYIKLTVKAKGKQDWKVRVTSVSISLPPWTWNNC